MRHVALTIRAGDLDQVLDQLLPITPQGVHTHELGDDRLELSVYGDAPGRAELESAAGAALLASEETEADDDPERRRLQAHGRRPPIGGRVVVRPEGAPEAGPGLLDIVLRRDGVEVEAMQAALTAIPPPPAPRLAANVPVMVHEAIAARLAPESRTVLVSGILDEHVPGVVEAYGRAGLQAAGQKVVRSWAAALLVRP